jgi:hypothetical protein
MAYRYVFGIVVVLSREALFPGLPLAKSKHFASMAIGPYCPSICASAAVHQPSLMPNTRCKITTMVKNPKNALKRSSAAWRQRGAWISRGRYLRFTHHT